MLSPWTTRHPVICLHEETGRPCLSIGDSAWRVTGYHCSTGVRLINEVNRFATSNSQPLVMLRAVVNGGLRAPIPAYE